jgi:hypothetical protein
VPAGSSGLLLEKIGDPFFAHEKELLLPRGLRFRVDSISHETRVAELSILKEMRFNPYHTLFEEEPSRTLIRSLIEHAVDRALLRFNPYHDESGRFASADGAPSGGIIQGGGAVRGSEQDPEFIGGLTAKDYPNGVMPGMVQAYSQYYQSEGKYPLDEWSPAEKTEARKGLAKELQTAEPSVRMPQSAFADMMAEPSPTIKNQWETGRTGAATGKQLQYTPKRQQAERLSSGIPENAIPADRPVYGYLARGDKADFLHANDPKDVDMALKKVSRTQFEQLRANPDKYYLMQVHDSEGKFTDVVSKEFLASRIQVPGDAKYAKAMREKIKYYPIGDGKGGINTNTVVGFANSEYGANSYGEVQVRLKRTMLEHSTVTVGDSIDSRLMGVPARLAERGDTRVPIQMASRSKTGLGGAYTEIQMFKHPTIQDFHTVRFTGAKPSIAVQHKLKAAGVPWEHDPMTKLLPKNAVPVDDIIKGIPSQVRPGMTQKELLELFRKLDRE